MVKKLDIHEILREYPPRFESRPYHSPQADCVKYFLEDVDHFADRIDCWLTLYRAMDDKRMIGFKLKNIRTLLSAFDELGLDVWVSKTKRKWIIRLKAAIGYVGMVEPSMPTLEPYHDVIGVVDAKETVDLVPI